MKTQGLFMPRLSQRIFHVRVCGRKPHGPDKPPMPEWMTELLEECKRMVDDYVKSVGITYIRRPRCTPQPLLKRHSRT